MSGKILHSITFTWKASVTPDDIARLSALLDELRGAIAGAERFDFGSGLGLAPNARDFGLVIVFDDEPAFRAYVAHPAHGEAAGLARAMAEDLATVQLAL
ncbi:Dabb family protein [Kitasatospora sp. NPDC051914]|uniref:Dabb family protein n=1 Tax=Kitasatospora sp. NPDC051914 TaxID=3154945 RepID=UPI00343EFE2E